MENSLDETEAHQSSCSPPKRRRSTFFYRNDSEDEGEVLQENVDTETEICQNMETEQRLADMSRYYEKLLSEKEQWKKEAKESRYKYHDLQLVYQMATAASSSVRLPYDRLTNEDIEFLNAKSNIQKLIESQQKLHNITKINVAIRRRLNELEDVVLDFCEKRVDKITEQILNNSSCEPETTND